MKLRALDQVHVSSVQADSLRPGQEFHVSDQLGNQMLKSLPGRVEQVVEDEPATETAPAEKAEEAPVNKAEPAAPANKAAPKGKAKGK